MARPRARKGKTARALSTVDNRPNFTYLQKCNPDPSEKPDMSNPSPKDFRDAMRAFVGNCSIISVGEGPEANGIVVTSSISLSAEPPLLLACINRSASCHPLFARYGCFGWNSLGASHQPLAERFSGYGGIKGAARFEGSDWVTAATGALLLADAPTAFDCTVEEMIDRATHTILIGRVRAIRTTPGMGALSYWNGSYRALAE